MNDKLLLIKLKKFRKYIEEFALHSKRGIEEVHELRVNSRELHSLLSKKEPFYAKLKKVIKLSNKIRDMDVFLEEYLNFLAKKEITALDIKGIKKSLNKKREKSINRLHLYLKFLSIPDSVKSESVVNTTVLKNKTFTKLNQKELHKYRIYIKKRLYLEKNSSAKDKKRIKTLTKIKDLLGTINDYYNGLKRLGSYRIKHKLYKEIKDVTKEENLKLLSKLKRIKIDM